MGNMYHQYKKKQLVDSEAMTSQTQSELSMCLAIFKVFHVITNFNFLLSYPILLKPF